MSTLAQAQPTPRRSPLFEVLSRTVPVGAHGLALEFDATARVHELAARSAAMLAELCATVVTVRLAQPTGVSAPLESGTGLELALAGGRTLWLMLDARSERALADALALRHLGLRGYGDPTGAERGLLEFAALACVERCAEAATLRRIVHGRELARVSPAPGAIAFEFELTCGGAGGRARAVLDRAAEQTPLVLDPQQVGGQLELRLALPALSLTLAEYDALVVGDVLLVGAESFAGFASRLELVTPGGWRVASAELTGDDALALRVRVGPLEPRLLRAASSASGGVVLRPFVGSRVLEEAEFERWSEGDELVLDKRASSAVELVANDGVRLAGELVRVAGELGVRVCSSARSAAVRP